jgi:hypothetical protein
MNAFDRDRLHEFLQFIQETRPKLDPDNPWAYAFGELEGQLTRTLGRHITPPGRPEPVILGKKVRKLLVPSLCCDAYATAEEMWGRETSTSLFDAVAKLGQHAAYVREVEIGVVWEVDQVRALKKAIDEKIIDTGNDLSLEVRRAHRFGRTSPAARKGIGREVRKFEKQLRRLEDARLDCKRFLDEAKERAAERVTVDA